MKSDNIDILPRSDFYLKHQLWVQSRFKIYRSYLKLFHFNNDTNTLVGNIAYWCQLSLKGQLQTASTRGKTLILT
ncbi:hypothetical protein [Nostoc sp.]|uniref:hypothetical protein n=1 Tax=Nostoc sp. TaxID=1180 RepID=UPI002FFC9293